MDEKYISARPNEQEDLSIPVINRGYVTNGRYEAGNVPNNQDEDVVEAGQGQFAQEDLVDDEPSMSAAELQNILVMIDENEHKNPRGALQKIKFFIESKLTGRREAREYRENFSSIRGTNADADAAVESMINRANWNFNPEAINMAVRARLENTGRQLDEQAEARLRSRVNEQLQRWRSLEGFQTEMNRNLQTMSTVRLMETIPQMVDAYALRNRRLLTQAEREVLLRHANQMVQPNPEVFGNANLLYAEIERMGNFNLNRNELDRLAYRYGRNGVHRNEVAEEVRRRLNERQMVEQAGRAIQGNLIRGLTYDFNRPFGEYIDETIAAHIGANRLNLTPTEIAQFRKRFAGEREHFETVIAQRRENVVRDALNQVNNRILAGLDDRLTTPMPRYIEGTLNNYLRENNLTLTPQEIQGLRDRFMEREEAYQQKIEEVRRQKEEMRLHKERKEDGIYEAKAAIMGDLMNLIDTREVHAGNIEESVQAAVERYIGQNPETGTLRNYIRPRHRGYLEATIRDALTQELERDMDFARTEAEIEDRDRTTTIENNYVAENVYTTSRDLINEITNANLTDEQVRELVQDRLRDQNIPNALRTRIEEQATNRVINRLTARRIEERNNQRERARAYYSQPAATSRIQGRDHGPLQNAARPAKPEAPRVELTPEDFKSDREKLKDKMEEIAVSVLEEKNGTLRDKTPEQIQASLNGRDENGQRLYPIKDGVMVVDGIRINPDELYRYIVRKKNNHGKNPSFWSRRN